jgi:hypothetical protein
MVRIHAKDRSGKHTAPEIFQASTKRWLSRDEAWGKLSFRSRAATSSRSNSEAVTIRGYCARE